MNENFATSDFTVTKLNSALDYVIKEVEHTCLFKIKINELNELNQGVYIKDHKLFLKEIIPLKTYLIFLFQDYVIIPNIRR